MDKLRDYCKVLGVKGEKCERLREFLKGEACRRVPKKRGSWVESEPVLWKGRDLQAEWKAMYKKLTGR